MIQLLLRMLVAGLFAFLFWLAFPAFLAAIGLSLSAALLTLVKVVIIAIALGYVFWGPPVPPFWRG